MDYLKLGPAAGQLYLICHLGAASLCGDSCLRIAEPGVGSYKYMLLMASLKFLYLELINNFRQYPFQRYISTLCITTGREN